MSATNPSCPPPGPHGPAGDSASVPAGAARELVLVKQGQRYVFRYVAGQEAQMLEGLAEMARDPRSDLNWFDAAVLSHQMGQGMSQELERLRKR